MNRYQTHAFPALDQDSNPRSVQHLSHKFDLASWGIEDVAFVKPIFFEGDDAYGIFAADGTELAQVENREEAMLTIRQNDLEAMSVH